MLNVRVFYHKTGRAKYISHLDAMRCMQRAIVRAGLPVWYTEGFNPHIYLTFPLPLPLGYESESEVMDFRLTDGTFPLPEVTERLDTALPPDIRVVRTALPVHKAEDIAKASYCIRAAAQGFDGKTLARAFASFMEQEEILVEKQAKKGARKVIKQVDIRPLCTLHAAKAEGDAVQLALQTAAGIRTNVNPSLLMQAFAAWLPTDGLSFTACRKALLLADGTAFS